MSSVLHSPHLHIAPLPKQRADHLLGSLKQALLKKLQKYRNQGKAKLQPVKYD